MAWIESHQELRGHPKTKRAARMLGLSIPLMVGHLHLLWWWALDFADDGCLAGFDPSDLAEAAMWDGDPTAFVTALVDCGPGSEPGFIEETVDGLILHDWHDYAGKLFDRREKDRERKRVQREALRQQAELLKKAREVQQMSGGHPTDGAKNPYRTVPNLTGPDRTTTNVGAVVVESRENAAHAAPPNGGNDPSKSTKGTRAKHDVASHRAMFEAIVETYGIDLDAINKTERGMVNAVATNLLDSHLEPDDVSRLRSAIAAAFPNMGTIPPTMLPKYVYVLKEPAPANGSRASPRGRAVDHSALNGSATDYDAAVKRRKEAAGRENAG